jgi:acetyl-CoA carboxylase biotin carboxyl carrier protein
MNFNEVKKLVKLVESSEIHELELERDGTKLRVCKAEPKVIETVVAAAPAVAPAVAAPAPAAAPVAALEAPAEAPASAGKDLYEIKSPIVGTFYRAPAPDADPYISVGDQVKPGQTLCIVEAMKLMNEIECDVSGRVVEILLDNQDPVEFGQALFRIDTQG